MISNKPSLYVHFVALASKSITYRNTKLSKLHIIQTLRTAIQMNLQFQEEPGALVSWKPFLR